MSRKARVIAFYLPQFHPIPENDEWWGKGFTEWTNTAKAKPLFPGHYQPHVPGDLGFYDLRVPETRVAQAEMAKEYGVEGFCYYHYWFGGKMLIERPFDEVLNSGIPDFPFCLCWANQTWTGIWHGAPDRVLIEQTYPGPEDDKRHFDYLLKAFHDERYMKIDGKPMFFVYRPRQLPDSKKTTDSWREIAQRSGLKDLYLVGVEYVPWNHADYGYDAQVAVRLLGSFRMNGTWKIRKYLRRLLGRPQDVYLYKDIYKHLLMPEAKAEDIHPAVFPNWDSTPRSGERGTVFHESSPDLFREHLRDVILQVSHKPYETRFIFVKSWNEWAEGNHLEPDLKFGKGYLEVLKEEIETNSR